MYVKPQPCVFALPLPWIQCPFIIDDVKTAYDTLMNYLSCEYGRWHFLAYHLKLSTPYLIRQLYFIILYFPVVNISTFLPHHIWTSRPENVFVLPTKVAYK